MMNYSWRPAAAVSLLRFAMACQVAVTLAGLLAWSGTPRAARAGDWPQILGPHRDARAEGEKLPDQWPEQGPERLWSADVGAGYAGPAVVGNRVILFHRVGDQERLEAFDLESGKSLWKTDFPAKYRGGIDPDKGPRCVPLVHERRVYAYGAAGQLHCVDLADGRHRWSRGLLSDYAGLEGYFGAGSTPIVAGGHLLVNVGGRPDAGLVAVALDDGRTEWKTTDTKASYSSPIRHTDEERELVVFITRLRTLGVEPRQGTVRFEFDFGQRGPTVNAASPVQCDDLLFVTASYGIGARMVRVKQGRVETVWENDRTLSSQYATPVYHGGYLYGTHGREDIGVAALRCVEARTGKVMWSEDGFGVAHAILAGERLLIVGTDGQLVLAQATPDGFRPLAKHRAVEETTRALPALSQGRLLLKTSLSDQDRLICLRVGS